MTTDTEGATVVDSAMPTTKEVPPTADTNLKKRRWEIIFVSNDQSEREYREYFNRMPWSTVTTFGPVTNTQDIRARLMKYFDVNALPYLTMNEGEGTPIFKNLRLRIEYGREAHEFPWIEGKKTWLSQNWKKLFRGLPLLLFVLWFILKEWSRKTYGFAPPPLVKPKGLGNKVRHLLQKEIKDMKSPTRRRA
eukprot:GHVO01052709.1.p1 GENE.GHVO01052709.1~~GHVO01052709.1.p1  ORF type:complete len:192 (-),score=35.79 GHVO01052709.1:98-673(-)